MVCRVAGWECQDLSPTGTGRGLLGPRSNYFLTWLGWLGHCMRLAAGAPSSLVSGKHHNAVPAQSLDQQSEIDFARDFGQCIWGTGCVGCTQAGSYAAGCTITVAT
jgi:hypothetical protein